LQLEELAQPTDEAAAGATDKVSEALSAPALAAQALDRELNAGGTASAVPGQTGLVNDLTGMVKKKKKDQAGTISAGAGSKRKADDDAPSPTEKKARVEEVLNQDS
jgi:HAT1-interacting factor 1